MANTPPKPPPNAVTVGGATFGVPKEVAPDKAVHTQPAGLETSGPSADTVAGWRQNFIELILQQIVLAIQNFLTPGPGPGGSGGGFHGISNFFGNLGSFLPIGLSGPGSGFHPVQAAVTFIQNIINGASGITTFLAGLIPGLDGSKIVTGTISGDVTGVDDLRGALIEGLTAPDGLSGGDNTVVTHYATRVTTAANGASGAVTKISSALAQQQAQKLANMGYGGNSVTFAPNGADGAPLT